MKYIFVCNSVAIAYRFRLPIIADLINQGHEVIVATFKGFDSDYYSRKIREQGIPLVYLDTHDASSSVLRVFLAIRELRNVIRNNDPDVVHSFTHIANLVAFFSSFGRGCHLILNLTGAGIVFTETSFKASIYQYLMYVMYFIMGRCASAVCFQNPDDLYEFQRCSRLRPHKLFLTNGSGFDDSVLHDFIDNSVMSDGECDDGELHQTSEVIKVLFPSRLLFHKGIIEFLEAANELVERGERFYFMVAGQEVVDANLGFCGNRIRELADGSVIYLGFRRDIYAVMAEADVIVLPSYYREGIPRTLIEALALGKPIITADSPGCRETVVDGRNGFLIEPKSAKELVHALLRLKESDIPTLGRRSRRLFDEKFKVEKVIQAYHNCYASVLEG